MEDLVFKPRPQRWILQPLDHGLSAPVMRPRRDNAGEVILPSSVRINISLYFGSLRPSLSNELNRPGHLAPQAAVGKLQMDNLHRHVSPAPDIDGLTDGVIHSDALVRIWVA